MSIKNWKVRLNGVAEAARRKEADFKAYIEAMTAEAMAAREEQEAAAKINMNNDNVEDAVIVEENKSVESASNSSAEDVK